MLETQKYLELVRERGEAGKELSRVYRGIRRRNLFLNAYANLYANGGALTPGIDPDDTVDGMSVKRIDNIIEQLEEGTFRWKPVRRTYIAKKHSSKKRPLGIPGWNDKLLQEVIKIVLEAYYEPQFRNSSHGFRPNRGCHTALSEIRHQWKGMKWFIEGDIKGCFDNISHEKLLEIIGKQIQDERLLKLLKGLLKAGYIEDWKYNKTYSGTPQGGIISPLLANIMLNELDTYVEDYVIPKYTQGDKRKRKWNPEYQRLNQRAVRAKKRGDVKAYREAIKKKRHVPVFLDDGCTWLKYVRYADDFLLGFAGSKKEAEEIKKEIQGFLENLMLELSEEKTFITNSRTGKARFLSYHIHTIWNSKVGTCGRGKGKTGQGNIGLTIPDDVIQTWTEEVKKGETVLHNTAWMNNSDYDIVTAYETKVQGLINYYIMAHDVKSKMGQVRYAYKRSLAKTLAAKHKCSSETIRKKYGVWTEGRREMFRVVVKREGKKPLIATYGTKPIRRNSYAEIKDEILNFGTTRTEVVERLLNNTCEICGSRDNVQGHHIKKLSDLKKKYRGQKEPPEWVKRMMAIRRKTLFVCLKCHNEIHQGKYDGAKLT
ncbi:MAG: hypothetical protein GY847_23765 [Proteobacteria bacterium]|nr:hypothetical protein [Pseudomonadota bacterium]